MSQCAVAFNGPDGTTIDTDGLIFVTTVNAGQTANWDGFTFRSPPAGVTPTCQVTEVVYNG